MQRAPKAFTLIELLVVIAIIGVLSSVILASLNTARGRARDAKRASDLTSIQTALELYYSANNHYPINPVLNWNSECGGWNVTTANNVIPGLVPSYLPQFPSDPGMKTGTNENCYLYFSPYGDSYKLLDYNLTDSVNPGSFPTLVDPARNYGQSYPRPAGCTGQEGTKSLAIWSGDNAMLCY